MFRTRDFVLLLVTVAFLLLAITYTVSKNNLAGNTDTNPVFNTPEISTVTAEIQANNEPVQTRAERLARLRAQIAESELVSISSAIVEEEVVIIDTASSTGPVAISEPQLCPDFNPVYSPNWPIDSIQYQDAEGVRQYFVSQAIQFGTTTSSTIQKQVFITLPQQSFPIGAINCLPSNVVGIALDNSLIRNNEINLYSIFSSETLIGYALDGFPIYGTGNQPTDECGGRMEMGQYRYELSADRSNLINCYRGPVQSFLQ